LPADSAKSEQNRVIKATKTCAFKPLKTGKLLMQQALE
jgi:hypothetical protein